MNAAARGAPQRFGPPASIWLLAVWLAAGQTSVWAASDYLGQVTFNGLPVPGATVTAVQGDRKVVATTDADGIYRLVDLTEGAWTLVVEMLGFAPVSREIVIPPTEDPTPLELSVLPLDELAQRVALQSPESAPAADISGDSTTGENQARTSGESASPAAQGGAFQRTELTQAATARPAGTLAELPDDIDPNAAADGLLINGSVNNGASTPFAQARAFGNNRRAGRSLYTFATGLQLGSSDWDARPFSLTGLPSPRPSYFAAQGLGTFQGPVRLPGLANPINLFVGYQGTSDTNAVRQWARMPTDRERAGDFSQTLDASGRPVRIVDPATGQPFDGNRIPANRISPQAAALLAYYPRAGAAAGGFNYEAPVITATRQDGVQSRLAYALGAGNQITGSASWQRTRNDATTLFGFDDARAASALDVQGTWSLRLSPFSWVRSRYQYTRATNESVPFFANRVNVSGEAGIAGNDQDPSNWGPPALSFASDLAGLTDARYSLGNTQTHAWWAEGSQVRGRHNVTYGGEVRAHLDDVIGQQDPRGTFVFTGAATGIDFADFLLGLPQASAIAFGDPGKAFRGQSLAAYVTDDWRVSPSLTLNLGVRWEYESPFVETRDRLFNLDVAPGFTAVSPVLAGGTGALTGTAYPRALLRQDLGGIQPRLSMAWRPVPGSSLVVRAGYGIYRNTNVYQPIAALLAEQPPLSTTFNIETSPSNPLTLADGFTPGAGGALNTFAVDPDFRVGFVQNWQVSAQRDLPYSLTVLVSYLGAKGSRLMQQFLPNTYPAGAEHPCPECPAGFRYLTSGGRSMRHAGQIQVRRRLRNGFTASIQYTLAKAMDDATALTGAAAGSRALAQDWLDLDAEYARSNFDQRHQVEVTVEYTTGASIIGGTLVDGWKGALFKDWTFAATLDAGSGLPLTPVYFAPVRGTGIVGPIRADLVGDPDRVPPGYYANPAAYAPPAPGRWGSAPRNSITGPRTFSLDASIARTFRIGDRLNLDWRIDATNVLNSVVYASVNTLITSPQFGLPTGTTDMRRLRSSIRLRF